MVADKSIYIPLEPDREKLNPFFDGYKLDLNVLPRHEKKLERGPDLTFLGQAQYTFIHVKTYGCRNLLTNDPYNCTNVYFVDSQWNILRLIYSKGSGFGSAEIVFTIPDYMEKCQLVGRISPSITFPSASLCLVSDGAGTLYMLSTEIRPSNCWKILTQTRPLELSSPFVLTSSIFFATPDEKSNCVDLTALHVLEENDATYLLILWITLKDNGSGLSQPDWNVWRVRKVRVSGIAEFVCVEPGGAGLHILSTRKPKCFADSSDPTFEGFPDNALVVTETPPLYSWCDRGEDIRASIPISSASSEVSVRIVEGRLIVHQISDEKQTSNEVTSSTEVPVGANCETVDVNFSSVLLEGEIGGKVHLDQVRWATTNGCVEIILPKADMVTWDCFLLGDTRGMKVYSEEVIDSINAKLTHLTSSLEGEEHPVGLSSNPQELEDCDSSQMENIGLYRLDGESYAISHESSLGMSQCLFVGRTILDKLTTPCFCLRHDVDGVVWTLDTHETDSKIWKHVGTLQAFGYVQASKERRVFSACSPGLDYAVIADAQAHAYLYRQPTPEQLDLRNRKTKQQVNMIARQHLISLCNNTSVRGMVAEDYYLALLLEDGKLIAINVA